MYAEAVAEKYPTPDPQQIKKRKGNFIAKWLAKSLRKELAEQQEVERMSGLNLSKASLVSSGPSIDQPERAIQFTIYTASGGRVVETRRYDRTRDRSQTGLYVITSDQDFGKEIEKIITMENLKS